MIPIKTHLSGFKSHPLLHYLVRVDLDLTGLCNRQCSFCPRSLDANPLYPNINKQMSLKTVEIVIEELLLSNFHGWIELAGRGESTLHKQFETIVDMLTSGSRRWKLRLTTNGYKINEWWNSPVGMKLDELLLNSYESEQEYIERQQKYKQLPSGGRVFHYYKQDGFTINQINNMPKYIEEGKEWRHAFNNRAGYFKKKKWWSQTSKTTVTEAACWHPIRQIFIDFDGNYQMCCNDWLNQIKIGNVHERSLIDMYINDPKVNRIRWHLLNNKRDRILPCANCDDIQGLQKGTVDTINAFKQTGSYREHVIPLAKLGREFDPGLYKGI